MRTLDWWEKTEPCHFFPLRHKTLSEKWKRCFPDRDISRDLLEGTKEPIYCGENKRKIKCLKKRMEKKNICLGKINLVWWESAYTELRSAALRAVLSLKESWTSEAASLSYAFILSSWFRFIRNVRYRIFKKNSETAWRNRVSSGVGGIWDFFDLSLKMKRGREVGENDP